LVAHDYGGAGNLREVMLLHAGVPVKKMIPFTYVFSSDKHIIYFHKQGQGSRSSYSIDKPRSLITLCTMMKAGKVRTTEWESSKTCLSDFLNLVEEREERPKGSDIVLITKVASSTDDICHALNYACSSIWYSQQRYPNVAEAMRFQMTSEEVAAISPPDPTLRDWMQ